MTAALPAAGKNVKQHTVRESGRGHVISSSLFLSGFQFDVCGIFYFFCMFLCVCVCARARARPLIVLQYFVFDSCLSSSSDKMDFSFLFFFSLKPRLLLWSNA